MNLRRPLRERLRGANGEGVLLPGHGRRRMSLVESFNYAVEGIIHVLRTHRNMRVHFAAAVIVLVLALVVILVIATKALTGRGTPLRGGLPSGHAAVAFAAWMAVTQLLDPSEHRFLVSVLMLGVASLVAYSRIETGIHSTLEFDLPSSPNVRAEGPFARPGRHCRA